MRHIEAPSKKLLCVAATATLLIPASDLQANDVDLFRAEVPPNVLMYVDNSSSMTAQVYHPDWSGTHTAVVNGSNKTIKNKKQTQCEYFREEYDATDHPTGSLGVSNFDVYNVLKSNTLKNVNGNNMYYRGNGETAWESPDFPIVDYNGDPMYKDSNKNGTQDGGEPYIYYRMLDPASASHSNWVRKNGIGSGVEQPIEDYQGNHLFYDADGDNTYTDDPNSNGQWDVGEDRRLYYELKGTNDPRDGDPKGAQASIMSYISNPTEALAAGIDPLSLEFASGTTICGVNASGYSLWGKDDPNAGSIQNGRVVKLDAAYLDFLFSTVGAQARIDTFDVAKLYDLTDASGVGTNAGKRAKAACITLLTINGSPEPAYYFTYRRSRAQAMQLILRQIVCRVNEQTDTGVRFGFAQFRYHGKPGDDNGAYVAVPVMDWYTDKANGTKTAYTLHGKTLTHEEHLQDVFVRATPDAQTPLNEGLFQLYTYFMSREATEMPYGRDWQGKKRDGVEITGSAHQFPVYNYDMSLYDPNSSPAYDLLNVCSPQWQCDPPASSFYLVGGRYQGSNPTSAAEDADVPPANTTVFDGYAAPDPITHACQKNFVLLITDGGSAGDDFSDRDEDIFSSFGTGNDLPASFDTATDRGYDNFYNLIGDHFRAPDADNPTTGAPDENKDEAPPVSGMKLLDDIALFMNRYDLRPVEADQEGIQTVDTYTVGYALESDAIDEDAAQDAVLGGTPLQRAAIRGNGRYFESADADALETDLVVAISEMIDKAQAFTSATVPASRTSDGNHFYASYFLPKNQSGFWEGHLKSFEFSALGDILDANGFCATGESGNVQPNPTCAEGGTLDLFADAFWDAAKEVPDPLDRALYVESSSETMFSKPTAFTTSVAASEFGIQVNVDLDSDGNADDGEEMQEPYLSAGLTAADDIRDAVVEMVRGCEFNSSPCEPRTNQEGTSKGYLGDIFHSNPVVVGSPNAPINDPTYKVYANEKRTRTRVIYAGSNDGFLHGFNAGTWNTTYVDGDGNTQALTPPRHNAGTGEELFGFMPAAVKSVMKDLPKVQGARTVTTVDGSPVVAEAWMYRAVSGGVPSGSTLPFASYDDKVKEQWRTVLMTGMRDGGRSYSALDVTAPQATASAVASGSGFPLYLWSFPCQAATAFCNGSGLPTGRKIADYMGNTWSEPVITRVRVAMNGGDTLGHERWVAIFGAGYDAASDPNQKRSGTIPVYDHTALRGRAIFMVDVVTGGVLAVKYFDADDELVGGAKLGFKEMKYAFASAPAVYDLNFDGYADVVYIPDLGGQVWKWVINEIGSDPVNDASNANIAQPNWPFRLFYSATPSSTPVPERLATPGPYDPTIHYQSFFFPPTGTLVHNALHLAFGAGERANPKGIDADFADGDPTNNNRYFVVKDDDPLEKDLAVDGNGDPIPRDPITAAMTETQLDNLDTSGLSCDQMRATKKGYFFNARDGERFVSNSVIFLGEVFTGSFIPPDPNSNELCKASGNGFKYKFDLWCGDGGYGDPLNDPPADTRRVSVGGGIPTRPRISVGDLNQGGGDGTTCKNKVVMITSDGAISNDCPGQLSGAGIAVRSWRQR